MKIIIVLFLHCFIMVRNISSSRKYFHAITQSAAFYMEDNYINNDYDYDTEYNPGPRKVTLEQYLEMIRASENVNKYPTDQIMYVLENSPGLKTFFETDEGNHHVGVNPNRFGTACKVTYLENLPLRMYDESGTQRTIINVESYKQRVHHGFCDESAPCELPREAVPGYNATCKQNYIKTPLLAYVEGEIKSYEFVIHCGCSCTKTRL